jgi:uncharacterized GH25 family protein
MKLLGQKYVYIFFAAVLLSALNISTGYAHDMWINMQDYSLEKSKPAMLTVGYGHAFVVPAKEFLSRDRVDTVSFLSHDGKEVLSVPEGDAKYQSKSAFGAEGSYLAVVKQRAGFSSKTVDGYQNGKNKKDLKDVIECKYSEKYAKALFTVGSAGGDSFSKVLGHSIEIVPMQDPAKLKKGDLLRVKILLQGKPARTNVYGTYAGFSEESGTFAYTTSTDKDGVAKIKLINEGTWLLLVKEEMAYPDATVCDKQSRAASLTFQVK